MADSGPARALDGEVGRVGRLAGPIVLGLLAQVAMGATDTLMVGRFGGEALAAMALAHGYGFAWVVLARGLVHGIDPLVAQAHGAGDREGVGRALSLGLVVGLAAGVPVTLAHWWGGPALAALGQPDEVVPLADRYCRALAAGVLPMMAWMACRQVLHGMGRVRPVMLATLAAALLNPLLNAWWMYGGLGLPGAGPVGCAWATSACQVLLLGFLLLFGGRPLAARWRGLREGLDPAGLRRVAALGVPVAVQVGLEVWVFNAATLLAGRLGAGAVAAHGVVLNLSTVTFMVPVGVGQAATTRVGNLVGAGRPWGRAALAAVVLGAGFMALSGGLLAAFPRGLLGLYTRDPAVLEAGAAIVPVAAAFQVFDGVQAVCAGVLRGLGDVRVPAAVVAVAHWCVGLPLGVALAFPGGLGLVGVWAGLAVGIGCMAGALLWRVARLARRPPVSPRRR